MIKIYIKNDNQYLEKHLSFYLKKLKNTFISYIDTDVIPIDGIVIFVTTKWKDNFVKNINTRTTYVVVLTDNTGDKTNLKNVLLAKVKPENKFLEFLWENQEINYKLNFTVLHEALSLLTSMIEKRQKGSYNLINRGEITYDKVIKFYNFPSQNLKITERDIDTSCSELSDISNYYDFSYDKRVNIFIPVYYRFEKTKRCIESIREVAKKSRYDVKIYIGDNNTKITEMKLWLNSIEEEVYFSEKNVGKANIVNHMFRNSRECDYIFSIDGDMFWDDKLGDYNFIDKMIECLIKCDNVGLVSSMQHGQSEHWFNGTIRIAENRGFKIGVSDSCVGISGGCIVMRTEDWKSVGGYKENHDIYTGDDGILTYNVYRMLNKMVIVSIDYGMIHPPPSDGEEGYTKWKQASWKRDQLSFINDNFKGGNKKGFYD